jgi:uncharacterized protein (AIM24 family)
VNNHEIDYKIYGDDKQFVEVELDTQETVIAEAGLWKVGVLSKNIIITIGM